MGAAHAEVTFMRLDRNQEKAVNHGTGPAIVIAGPGSGKTTVVTARILNLIQTHNIPPSQILAIAFNRKAVEEMETRILRELASSEFSDNTEMSQKPVIRTLHAFGKDIIIENYERAGFNQIPEIWAGQIDAIIAQERTQIERDAANASVAIYKIESKKTGRCYIGQTLNPNRRRKEHFEHSSNDRLRQAIRSEGESHFIFEVLERVPGWEANRREAHWIKFYKDRSVIDFAQEIEKVSKKSNNTNVVIYKIKSMTDVTAHIGYTTDPESVYRIIENDENKRLSFEVLHTEVSWTEAPIHIENEIKKHKNWAVFNRGDPERAGYSNQLFLEMFCQHFDISYEESLDTHPDFENLRDRFNEIKETVMRAKRKVTTGLFDPTTLDDPVAQVFAVKYETLKTKANAVDFEDMIIHAANLLETCPDLRQTYRDTYPYLLVDEFQDISPADFRLISLLSENLFAVGDDDQAIYGFRGGDSKIMQKFTNRRDVAKYEITRNYRSTSTIVEHARALIERNQQRIRKNLRAHNPFQQDIKIVKTTPETAETLLRRELKSSQETAVLARTNYETDRIQEMLARCENPIEVTTIHKAKGREWEKVILVHNTLARRFPRRDNDLAEERRVFYVAMTRAKQKLVVLGGTCPFVPEFEKIPKNIGYYFRQFAYWRARMRLKKVGDVK